MDWTYKLNSIHNKFYNNINMTNLEWKVGSFGWYNAYDGELKLKIPSVTTIINSKDDPELDNWIKEVGEEVANKIMKLAADRGKVMHKFLENYFYNILNNKNKEKSLEYTQIKTPEYAKKSNINESSIITGRTLFYQLYESDMMKEINNVVGLENKLISKKYLYRGQYDINYYTPNGELVITDYKTSSSPIIKNSVKEAKMKLQLAAYWQAYEEEFPEKKLDYAKLWISVKDYGTQEISINKEEKEDLIKEFLILCKNYHKERNQEKYLQY